MLALGGYLKKKENLSARLGDVLSCMYLASMVLKHHENQGSPEDELPIVEWSCRHLLYDAQEQLHAFLRNFPNRFLAGLMRLLIFPRGQTYFAPSDRLGRSISDLIMNPTEARERLCRGIYKTVEPTNPLGLLQEALTLSLTAEPIGKRIRVEGQKTGKVTALDLPGQITQSLALGLITETEAAMLREYDRKVMDLINVDDFAPHELGVSAQPRTVVGSATARQRPGRLNRLGEPEPATPAPELPAPRSAPVTRCLNCNAVLNGVYCSECGQRMQLRRLTMGALFNDFLHDLTDLDSRVWRTLIALLTKPGKLTNEFIAGRRTLYLPPFRLYLVLSLIFFSSSVGGPNDLVFEGPGKTSQEPGRGVKEAMARLEKRSSTLPKRTSADQAAESAPKSATGDSKPAGPNAL